MIALLLAATMVRVPPVLMYHRVDTSSPPDVISERLTTSPRAFAADLALLRAEHLRAVGIDDLYRLCAEHRPTNDLVLVTFDDGYRDQYRYAFPILRRFGMTATFFITTANVGTAHHLTWNEIRTMANAGMSIGGHSVEHVSLSALDFEDQMYQVVYSVATLRNMLHVPVIAYAYPDGLFDRQTIAAVRRARILFAFTTDPIHQDGAPASLELTRIRVLAGTPLATLAAELHAPPAYVRLLNASGALGSGERDRANGPHR